MPLGLFSSGKAQVLAEEKPEKAAGGKKKEPKQLSETKCKGVSLKLDHTRVTIEKQIAEGGFAIVYIASDRKNTKFALKRQFTKENQKQLDACCREHNFLKQCVGHKNIVEFVDSYVNCLGNGIWECMLLTEYHHKNVFQLMNERSSTNQFLTGDEIQSIFCDMCEAVSFIHNRPIPIIHRDLKVENVLISSHKPPNYVLCDFGSATTQVLSVEQHGVEYVRAEVERNTTMCYRSPEMIDLYSGQVLGLKGDLWALGVLLYRLCYFCVPFDESPLAIQSVNYQFPAFPNINDDIKVLIYMLLDVDVNRRPSIFQLSVLAFEANRKAIPREIEERRQNSEPIPSLEACLRLMRSERKPRNQKASSTSSQPAPTSSSATLSAASGAPLAPSIVMTSGVTSSGETSVQPRLRPKPTTIVPNVPSISPVPPPISMKTPSKPEESEARRPTAPSSDFHHRQSFSGEDRLKAAAETGPGGPLSCPLIKPADLGFTDLAENPVPRDRAQTDGKRRGAGAQEPSDVVFQQQHRRNVSDTSHLSRSAFKPYSSQIAVSSGAVTTTAASSSQVRSVEDVNILLNNRTTTTTSSGEWNPFLAAPFASNSTGVMDDSYFGEVFDEIRKKKVCSSGEFSDTSSIDSRDPFGAAPFDQLTVSTSSSAAAVAAAAPSAEGDDDDDDDERQLLSEDSDEEERMVDARNEPTEHDAPARHGANQTDEDSEIDEQRMNDRRRYSYENIDGVGDDASSDSRGRTDRDDSEEEEEEEEEDDSRRGGDTSHDEDSQNTVGSEDGEGGSRPLLEDDGLEDDDDHELISSFSSSTHFPPLFVGTSSTTTTTTNPFLRDELTPKMVSPRQPCPSIDDDDWDLGDRWTDRRDTVFERPAALAPPVPPMAFAPATLPRQVTPLSAVCKLKPDLPTAAPVSIIPSMSTTSFPEAVVRSPEDVVPREPPVGTLISVGAPTQPPSLVSLKKHEKVEKAARKEKKKEKKERKTRETAAEKGSSEMETDGSEAEMWQHDAGKKKKKSTFGLRSSHPSSIVANELRFAAPIPSNSSTTTSSSKKGTKEKKSSSAVKKSSVGSAKMASFVNTSFQPEDADGDISTDL